MPLPISEISSLGIVAPQPLAPVISPAKIADIFSLDVVIFRRPVQTDLSEVGPQRAVGAVHQHLHHVHPGRNDPVGRGVHRLGDLDVVRVSGLRQPLSPGLSPGQHEQRDVPLYPVPCRSGKQFAENRVLAELKDKLKVIECFSMHNHYISLQSDPPAWECALESQSWVSSSPPGRCRSEHC